MEKFNSKYVQKNHLISFSLFLFFLSTPIWLKNAEQSGIIWNGGPHDSNVSCYLCHFLSFFKYNMMIIIIIIITIWSRISAKATTADTSKQTHSVCEKFCTYSCVNAKEIMLVSLCCVTNSNSNGFLYIFITILNSFSRLFPIFSSVDVAISRTISLLLSDK